MKSLLVITAALAFINCFGQVDSLSRPEDELKLSKEPIAEDSIYNWRGPSRISIPVFPGGRDSLNAYLKRETRYPREEKENGISGKVYMEFVVEKDGSISNVRVLKGIKNGRNLELLAVKLMENSPKWNPAMRNGLPVRCWIEETLGFTLK